MDADEHEISVSIGPKLAEFFRTASAEDQARFQQVLEALVGHMNTIDIQSVGKMMDDADIAQDCGE